MIPSSFATSRSRNFPENSSGRRQVFRPKLLASSATMLVDARGLILQRELRQIDSLAVLCRRLMSANADARPVGAGYRVGERISVFEQSAGELMNQVGVRTSVSPALD